MSIIDKVVTSGGDLAKLTIDDRATYYKEVCESVGLNPLTEPFKYITLNGKLTLYATKSATEQLRKLNGISLTIISTDTVGDVYIVRVRATDKDSRIDESTGAVSIAGLKSDALANAIMKCETKSKRRVTLSISGLGYLDESELETIPGVIPGPAVTLPPETAKEAPAKEVPPKTEAPPVKEAPKTEAPAEAPAKKEVPPKAEAPAKEDVPAKEEAPPKTETPAKAETPPEAPTGDTGEMLDFNIIIMGAPRKKNGKEEYGVPAVIAEPAEFEGEVELIAPTQFKDLLINGAALAVIGALSGKALLASSVKNINVEDSEPAADISDDLVVGKQSIIKLNGNVRPGKLAVEGKITESFYSYVAGRTNTFVFGDTLEGFVDNDVVKITVKNIIEKDGKTLVVVSTSEKVEAKAS